LQSNAAIFHSVLECHGKQTDVATFDPKIGCRDNVPLSNRNKVVRLLIYDQIPIIW